MKIDTAECKKALEAKYGKGSWKRTSKMKDGENTIRHFSKDGDDSYIVASHTDKGIYLVDKLDMEDVPNGDAEKLKEIERIECGSCNSPAEFMVSLADMGGIFHVDKDGEIIFTYTGKVSTGDNVKDVMKGRKIEDVLGSCNECEDECSLMIYFTDGDVTTDEAEAFEKAFGIKVGEVEEPAPVKKEDGKPDYKSSKGVLKALSNLHPIFIQWLETQFDPDNCGSFKEYMDNSDGTVFCDLDGCLEWAKEVHGINMMDDDEADKKGSALIEQHLKDNIPADFPYMIQTEDYVVLWRPAQKGGMILKSIEELPQNSLEIEKWLHGEVEKNRKLKEKQKNAEENKQALQDRLDEFDALKKRGVTGSKTVPANKYLFCLMESDMLTEGVDNNFFVIINPVAYWKKTGYLADGYEEDESEEISAVADEIGLSEEMESHFMFINKISKEDARNLMLARGFCEDAEFNKKMGECS